MSAPDIRVCATDQSMNDASRIANEVVNAKISTEMPRKNAPSAIDRERPHLSATAPVGTSSATTPTRKSPSAAVTAVRLKP